MGGVIYQDDLWQLPHIEPLALVGRLVLKPPRHIEGFADLTAEVDRDFPDRDGASRVAVQS